MSFLNRVDNGKTQNVLMRGGNAPKNMRGDQTLIEKRGLPKILLNNAPAMNPMAAYVSNTQQTPIQRAYVAASAATKINSAGNKGAASWVGKSFG